MFFVGIGELLWDVYPDSRHLGGAIFNCVHHFRQLGHEGLIISRIGNDPQGKELLHVLKTRGFNTEFVQIDKERETGYVTVELDKNAEPTFACTETAPYDFLEWKEQFSDIAPAVDTVIFGTFAQRNEQSARVTLDFLKLCKNAVKVFDVNFRGWNEKMKISVMNSLPYTDILKMNEDELQKMKIIYPDLPGDTVSSVQMLVKKKNLRLACLTTGKWGCLIADSSNIVYCPGAKLQPVDTTGAGDAFMAALTLKYIQGVPLHEAGHFANIVALHTILQKGATPLYTMDTITNISHSVTEYNIFDEWRDYIVQNC